MGLRRGEASIRKVAKDVPIALIDLDPENPRIRAALGGTVGVLALALGWNRADTETFAKFVGSMGLSSAISANPLLLVVTVAALAKALPQGSSDR